jgi:hypothetical protein
MIIPWLQASFGPLSATIGLL